MSELKPIREELRQDYVEWSHIKKSDLEHISEENFTDEQKERVKVRFDNEKILLNNIIVTAKKLKKRIEEIEAANYDIMSV